ncbi:uncharacterized protein LOC133827158 [Humulus lupulus]|uniref:uncharacterized protein LOC133827158 n=1 Tax=Humulus lupulus TaxID=3486 RepID=UPI002B4103D3|nr:uncharacterized protein LOC133827158 [Humulus lupulus]
MEQNPTDIDPKPSQAVAPAGSRSNDTGWARPKRTGNGKAKVSDTSNPLRNSYSALQESQKVFPEQVGIGALLETKIKGDKIKAITSSTFYDWNYYSNDFLEGQILLIWKPHLAHVDIIQDSSQMLHCHVHIRSRNLDFFITTVYGSNCLETRKVLWNNLSQVHLFGQPWLVLGDFNAVFDRTDQLGGRPISRKEMEDAQAWFALGLVEEKKVMGPVFTWSNNQEDGHRIYSKLDRIFCNEPWMNKFPSTTAFSQREVISDHSSLLIKPVEIRKLGIQPFRYFNMWASHHRFREIVLESWSKPICSRGDSLSRLAQKLTRLKHVLKRFNWRIVGDVGCQFEHSKSLFQQVQNALYADPNNDSLILAEREALKKRKSANRIVSYLSDDGTIVDDYDKLDLIKPFTAHDVKLALSSIHPVKSPGPDGYGAGFFKVLWKEISREVDQPATATDFRPIACYTTIYKCISKMLCTRLATILPSLIKSNQGAFIKHRSLAYNVLIFQDLIKGYNRKNSSPRCAMKIDLSKAYDSIDWDFLENLLKDLCFPSKFIRWIMICLRGTSYALLLNGRIQGHFQGCKGLRQGDPIFPLLFVIVMDYLTRLFIKASKDKGFRFYPMCKSLNLVNLYFADDLPIFCKANPQSVQILHSALIEFSLSSGLSINFSKS